MVAAKEKTGMAKKMGRPKGGRDDVSVKIDRRIVTMAKVIAGRQGTTATEVLSEMLKAPVNRVYAQLMREINEEEGVAK